MSSRAKPRSAPDRQTRAHLRRLGDGSSNSDATRPAIFGVAGALTNLSHPIKERVARSSLEFPQLEIVTTRLALDPELIATRAPKSRRLLNRSFQSARSHTQQQGLFGLDVLSNNREHIRIAIRNLVQFGEVRLRTEPSSSCSTVISVLMISALTSEVLQSSFNFSILI